jgi:hypothetical protein
VGTESPRDERQLSIYCFSSGSSAWSFRAPPRPSVVYNKDQVDDNEKKQTQKEKKSKQQAHTKCQVNKNSCDHVSDSDLVVVVAVPVAPPLLSSARCRAQPAAARSPGREAVSGAPANASFRQSCARTALRRSLSRARRLWIRVLSWPHGRS